MTANYLRTMEYKSAQLFRTLSLRYLIISFVFSLLMIPAVAQTTVNVGNYGLKPEDGQNAGTVVRKILKDYEGKDNVTIVFPKGRYDFYPDEFVEAPPFCSAFEIKGFKGLTIDGGGSNFYFHGLMHVAAVRESEDITFKHFSVDWQRPLLSQAEVIGSGEDYLDVFIDSSKYPYKIEGGQLYFLGEGWCFHLEDMYMNIYTPNGDIKYNTWDATMGEGLADAEIVHLGGDSLRFLFHLAYRPARGDIITMYCKRYSATGFECYLSRDILFEDIEIRHACGHGIFCSDCENITEQNVRFKVNREAGRVFTTVADANHILSCKGMVAVRSCLGEGHGDDFINVHGQNVPINAFKNRNAVFVDHGGFHLGDTVAFISSATVQREYFAVIEGITQERPCPEENVQTLLTFDRVLPENVDRTFFLENMTLTPSFIFENNTITKTNRARGILFTTPKPVIIRNNVFKSAGTAILIEGDINYWYESGACNDVSIYGNVFDNCLTSGNRDDNRWQWGDAVITITPSHRPTSPFDKAYHRNIRIYDNTFRVFDVPLVRAISVDGFSFLKNRIIRTFDYSPYAFYKESFTFDGCRNVVIGRNKVDKKYETRTISTLHMSDSDIKAKGFKIIR